VPSKPPFGSLESLRSITDKGFEYRT